MKKILIQLSLIAAIGLTAASARAGQITAKGSDTLVILAQKWAEVYMGKNPGVKIQVTGGGSGTGFAALQNQTTDLANASRKIKAKDSQQRRAGRGEGDRLLPVAGQAAPMI